MTNDDNRTGIHAGRVASGLVVLALGALMLLDRHHVVARESMRFFPGIALIVLGTARVLWGESPRRKGAGYGGLWLVIVGAWLIVSESHLFGLTYHDSWPLLVIAVGVMIVLRELVRGDDGPASSTTKGLPPR